MASFLRTSQSDRPARRRPTRRTPRGNTSAGNATSEPPGASGSARFVLYVEGPRDQDLLRTWAGRLSRKLARSLEPCGFILGGRRPARAIEDFQERGGGAAGVRGLVVLDRDHHDEDERLLAQAPGLELFTWSRRHIESYVLVPAAIRRILAGRVDAPQLDRLMSQMIPHPDDEPACRAVNAKQLLGHKGPLARSLGEPLSPARIARAMRAEELHPDVLELFSRVRSGLGLEEPAPQVVRRTAAE